MEFLYIFTPIFIVTLILGRLLKSDVVVDYKDISKESLKNYWIFPHYKKLKNKYIAYVLFSGLALSVIVYYPFTDFWSNFLAKDESGEKLMLFMLLLAFIQFINLGLFIGIHLKRYTYKLVFNNKYTPKQVRKLKESTSQLYVPNVAKSEFELMETVYYLFNNLIRNYFKTNHEYQYKLTNSELLYSLFTKEVIDEKNPELFESVKLITDKPEYVDSLTKEEWENLRDKFSEITTEIENRKQAFLTNYEQQKQLKIKEREEMQKKIGDKFQEERKLLVKNIVK